MTDEFAGMHHKFTVIDAERVLTGSFNYSSVGARNNYENIVLITSARIAESFNAEYAAVCNR